ncbi:MAG TPA: glycoside hydrolase family 15 protein [Mycobacteriales bacterium]|nr:glycoside hydrolase family 15 protein [Mycobacteriales bacterium]
MLNPGTTPAGPGPSADLVASSLTVIRDGQHLSGGYVACPSYPTYRYAWLRDGAFCAYAMDLHGRAGSADAFHRWVARTVLAHRNLITTAVHVAAAGAVAGTMPPTRYTLTGEVEADVGAWPNFQLDGYGTWLWALRDHLRRRTHGAAPGGSVLSGSVLDAAGLVADYLVATRHLPCFDCWEESGDRRHTSTLAAVSAGLDAAADLLDRPALAGVAAELRADLDARHLRGGCYVKHDATDAVDASLLWLALPFGVVAPDDPRMVATAARIRADLVGPGGGVRRYLGDEFYGGGQWILLTAWLGWYRAVTGDRAGARSCRDWIDRAATGEGWLPEQTSAAPQDPAAVEHWVRRWGPVATPLLWSHAMYLVLDHALEPRAAR